ncbi:MAG: hypothetical protein JO314_12235, partial [Acidobacteria bacterium]|nr:hypothetical protein [Acidobacteriota bacterium]
MELEFDKEIDAILRAARGARGAPVSGGHLDADQIAAFAENAVPVAARRVFTGHLADCDRCRTLLSHSIQMNEMGEATAPAAAVDDPVVSTVPWYSRLFRTPNLAIAMGALVVV